MNLGGRSIPPGKLVLPMLGSANRDACVFVDGESFDVRREPNPHLAFGHGVHFCLGASLARLEARIALGDILDRMEDIELASPEAWEPRPAFHVHRPVALPIRFKPLPRR